MSQKLLLVKYLSHAGYCARRTAALLIKEGKVKVNGRTVKMPWYEVQKDDLVEVGKTKIRHMPREYVLLNKPAGYVTSCADEQGRSTVMSLLQGASKGRLYPIGRLDKETKGLLLFTNDGELAHALSHPRFEVEKVYCALVHQPITDEHKEQIAKGVRLKDGFIKPDAVSWITGRRKNYIKIQIHSGKNRIIRRLLEHFGYQVIKLERVNYAGLTQKGLPMGAWRRLNKQEIARLLKLTQKDDSVTHEG